MATKANEQGFIKDFNRFLNDNKFRHTPERYKILAAIKETNNHFEADDLVFQLRQKKIPVSRATVYRTLSLLEESGILRKFRFDENHFHYELATENKNHAHLVCTDCGTIIEFDDDALVQIQKTICNKHNYKPVRQTVEIYGVCPQCQGKKI